MMQDRTAPSIGGRAISINTLWNVGGAGAPLAVAVFSIPLIIAGLGTDRFGLLALAWTVIGYFGVFDLGLGVATTKFVAEFHQQGRHHEQRKLILLSALMHLVLGCFGGVLLAALTSWLVQTVLNVPPELQAETKIAFYVLSLSIPIIVVTACFRGALEGLHRFDLVNMIKVPASIANYVSPLLVLWFTTNLAVIVTVMAATRMAALAGYLWLAANAVKPTGPKSSEAVNMVPALLRYGGWLSITNFVTPILVSLDRFLIGAFVSASAVAYYATPYEVITKLWIFSAGLLSVLLPVFSALAVDSAADIRVVLRQAVRILLAVVAPLIGVVLALGGDLLFLWVGDEFRQHSTSVSRWIAIGMLFNVVAQVPLTALHGIGRTDVTAKIFCVELVFYSALAWLLVHRFGIDGIAFAWAARAFFDSLILFAAGNRMLPGDRTGGLAPPRNQMIFLVLFLTALLLIGVTVTQSVTLKLALVLLIIIAMARWEWRCLLLESERESIKQLATQIRATLLTRGRS
jgi:O-antigen/teichoic acid export membrane protein